MCVCGGGGVGVCVCGGGCLFLFVAAVVVLFFVSAIVNCPVLLPWVVDGRFRNPLSSSSSSSSVYV